MSPTNIVPVPATFLRLAALAGVFALAACDCGGSRTGRTTVGVTLVQPAGEPEDFERTVDFGRVKAGELRTQRIELRNDGRARARITKAELIAESESFLLAGAAVLPELDVSETFEMELRFLPFTVGRYEATVVIETSIPETERYTIHFRATAVTSRIDVCTRVEGREVCGSENDDGQLVIDLGLVKPGDESRMPLIVKNRGDGDLDVTDIRPTESTSSEFSLSPDEGPVQVGPESQVEYEVVYNPLDGGLDEGEIELLSDDPQARRVVVLLRAEGNAPRICVRPFFSVDFGEQDVGTEVTKILTLDSCGREAVTVSNFVFFAGDRGHFAVGALPSVPLTLQPGEKTEIEVTYAPQLMGEDRDGRLTIFSNAPGSERGAVPVVGTAVGCELRAAPSPVSFGDLSIIGESTRTIVLSNTGTGKCRVSEFLEPAAPFFLGTTPEVPLEIDPGHQGTFQVGFRPRSEGQVEGEAVIVANVPDGELTVPLRGKGITPPPCDLQANPDRLVYVGVDTGQSVVQEVELRNFGTKKCYIHSGEMSAGTSPAFSASVTGFPPEEIPSGGSYRLPVKFQPSTSGTHTGSLEVKFGEDAAGGFCFPPLPCPGGSSRKLLVSLEGRTLAPKLCLTPAEVVFGDVNPGTQVERTFNISSCGQGALGVRGIAMAMGTSTAFVLGPRPTLPQFLPAGRSIQMKVLYRPRTSGGDFGAVNVLTNDPDHPEAQVRLRGNADEVCPRQLACNNTRLTFATQDVGRSTSLSVTCQAVGSEPVTVAGVDFARGTSHEFRAFAGELPRVVRPGDAVRVEVTYVPQDVGDDLGALEIDSDSCIPTRIELEAAGRQPNYPRCPPPQVFQPVELWEWPKSNSPVRQSQNVGMSPVVINLNDDNGDGRIDEEDTPDVIFTSCRAGECCVDCTPTSGGLEKMDVSGKGMLRAAQGKDGRDLWAVTDSKLMLTAMAQIAAADLDGDNVPEIIAIKHHFKEGTGQTGMEGKYETGTLLVFDNEGRLKYETEPWIGSKDTIEQIGAPTLGDLDNDGHPEIVFESTVFNANGTVLFHMPEWANDGHGSMVSLVDLDGDGVLEIVAGRTVYRADGSKYWQSKLGNGITMVIDVDGDGVPEVVLRDRADRLHVLNGQTGAVKAGPITWPKPKNDEGGDEGICSASMAAADLDGDGRPEIIVPSGDKLLAIKVTGSSLTKMWEVPIVDYGGQCGASGAAAFDFEGDGKYEVVYHDTQNMYVYRGTNGQKIYQSPRNSSTLFETPVIADVNNDGRANLVMTNENGIIGIGGHAGIKVLSNVGNNWPGTRRIWNQHTYHISDVNENGTIPRVETPHYKTSNSWRAQQPLCTP